MKAIVSQSIQDCLNKFSTPRKTNPTCINFFASSPNTSKSERDADFLPSRCITHRNLEQKPATKRIVIIGSPGAGKTTLAKKLGSLLNIKVFHLDRLFWYPGWKGKTSEDRIDILQHLTGDKQWIIEGTYLKSSEPRLEAADTIVFLDFPNLLCLWRIFKRNHDVKGQNQRDLAPGHSHKITWSLIIKVLTFPRKPKKTIIQILESYKETKDIHILCNDKEVDGFLVKCEQINLAEQKSSAQPNKQLISPLPIRNH